MAKITIEQTIHAPIEKVWEFWTTPEHIMQWNSASPDWHTPKSENDLRVGGKFVSRMESRDGKMGFDFGGTYTEVILNEKIAYTMDDSRTVSVVFEKAEQGVKVTETFDAEAQNPEEFQKKGWQSILDNFKKYAEKAQE